jgi:predicted signal transduction protein with EAL and GGDEF domain
MAHRLADLALPHAGSPFGVVTVCVGAAALNPSGATAPVDLVQAADRALYVAKRDGRNRVAQAEVEDSRLSDSPSHPGFSDSAPRSADRVKYEVS